MTDLLAIIQGIGTIIALVVSGFGLYKIVRMANREVKQADKNLKKTDVEIDSDAIDATGKALQIANDAAKQVADVRAEMGALQKKHTEEMTALQKKYVLQIDNFKMDIEEFRFELEQTKAELECYRDGYERSSHKLQSLGELPIKLKPVRVVEHP